MSLFSLKNSWSPILYIVLCTIKWPWFIIQRLNQTVESTVWLCGLISNNWTSSCYITSNLTLMSFFLSGVNCTFHQYFDWCIKKRKESGVPTSAEIPGDLSKVNNHIESLCAVLKILIKMWFYFLTNLLMKL